MDDKHWMALLSAYLHLNHGLESEILLLAGGIFHGFSYLKKTGFQGPHPIETKIAFCKLHSNEFSLSIGNLE